MKTYYPLLVTIAALLTGNAAFSTATESDQIKVVTENSFVDQPENFNLRSLRGLADTDERGGLVSFARKWINVKNAKKLVDTKNTKALVDIKIPDEQVMKMWVAADRSDEYVKQQLGLTGLTGDLLKNHPNYKYLSEFWYKLEGKQLTKLIDEGESTRAFWKRLKLNKMTAGRREHSKELQIYERYVTMHDNKILSQKGLPQPANSIRRGSAEMDAKVAVWAKLGRSRDYVKRLLNLDGLSTRTRMSDEYYREFLRLTAKAPEKVI